MLVYFKIGAPTAPINKGKGSNSVFNTLLRAMKGAQGYSKYALPINQFMAKIGKKRSVIAKHAVNQKEANTTAV
ncbi:hypothetical protein NBRC116583_37520 [Arenicella sp. 4NH20-0111]